MSQTLTIPSSERWRLPFGATQRALYDRLLASLTPEDPDRAQVVARATHYAVHGALWLDDTTRLDDIAENHTGVLVRDSHLFDSEPFAIGAYKIHDTEPLPSLQFKGSGIILGLNYDDARPSFNLVSAEVLAK